MAGDRMGLVLEPIRSLFERGALGGLSEGLLLDRFLKQQDEAAFDAILSRHGPMVLGVCRRVLSDAADVEDAFQATFLVLVRRAASLRDKELLGNWLYGVAHRVAVRARANAYRRRLRESHLAEEVAVGAESSEDDKELRAVLDSELSRLPDQLRAAVVLCDLEGIPQEEAAQRLGCPVGTVKSRLSRGRDRLRARLIRRGVGPAAIVALEAVLATNEASAAVPAALRVSTIRAAKRLAAGAAASTPAAALVEGVVRSMIVARIRTSATAIVALGVVAIGALTLVTNLAADDPPKANASANSTPNVPAGAATTPEGPGKIYVTMQLPRDQQTSRTGFCAIAVDPETGEWVKVVDRCEMRPTVSPDGLTIAFTKDNALWTQPVAGGAEPKRILSWEESTVGAPAIWSRDGKRLIISTGTKSDTTKHWVFKTFRLNADGTGVETLKIPPEDGVFDWSADGEWLLIASSRNAKIGWQLYLMHPNGTGVRQITEGGNPFYTRFSPDGRQVLYHDGTTEERRGVWVVGLDGKDRRRVFPTGTNVACPCWSPDGKRIAIGILEFDNRQGEHVPVHIEIMDLQGEHRVSLTLPEGAWPDMPDWR
jgi:RNA polymerase sigma factor (sigma-70 family)